MSVLPFCPNGSVCIYVLTGRDGGWSRERGWGGLDFSDSLLKKCTGSVGAVFFAEKKVLYSLKKRKLPHEAIHANRFISQVLDYCPGNTPNVSNTAWSRNNAAR